MNQAAPKADAPMSFPIPNFGPALNALQKELFDTFDGMNREWVSRVQSEAKLATAAGCWPTARSSWRPERGYSLRRRSPARDGVEIPLCYRL
jgi:hypothetical protein